MLVKDETRITMWRNALAREAERDRQRKWAADVLEHARIMLDPGTSPTNWERQYGKRLSSQELETLLLKLNRNFVFEVVDLNPTKKRLFFVKPDQTREQLCLYENRDFSNPMPEFSIFDWRYEEVIDPDVKFVDRKDLSFQWKGLEVETDEKSPNFGDVRGEGYTFNQDIRPGIIRVRRPWHEIVRGWRTVLARVVEKGYATPEAVERLVGPSVREAWAEKMGKAVERKSII